MAFCSKCGAQIPDDASFCPKCGNEINAKAQDTGGEFYDRHMDRHMRRAMRRGARWQWRASPAYVLIESISAGVMLILLGLLLYLAATGATSLVTWTNFWAYFLIGIGLYMLVRFFLLLVLMPESGYFRYGSLIGGIVLIVIGGAFLAWNLGGWQGEMWPFIIVVGGVVVILAGLARYYIGMSGEKKV